MNTTKVRPYRLSPLPIFGMEVHGIDIKKQVPPDVVEMIKADVTRWAKTCVVNPARRTASL